MCFGKASCICIIKPSKVEVGGGKTSGYPNTVIQERHDEDCISQNSSDCK